jgi:hypothetical protein
LSACYRADDLFSTLSFSTLSHFAHELCRSPTHPPPCTPLPGDSFPSTARLSAPLLTSPSFLLPKPPRRLDTSTPPPRTPFTNSSSPTGPSSSPCLSSLTPWLRLLYTVRPNLRLRRDVHSCTLPCPPLNLLLPASASVSLPRPPLPDLSPLWLSSSPWP